MIPLISKKVAQKKKCRYGQKEKEFEQSLKVWVKCW